MIAKLKIKSEITLNFKKVAEQKQKQKQKKKKNEHHKSVSRDS